MRRFAPHLVVVALFAVAFAGYQALRPGDQAPASYPRPDLPPPTEHWLDEDAERVQKKARKAWFRQMHRAADGVDYKLVERENGRQQILKRNTLAVVSPPRADGDPIWVERGSDNLAGRMHVAQHSSDHQWLYAGSALGGIWKTELGGDEWTPIGDNLYGGVHWMVVVPSETVGAPDLVIGATDWGYIHVSEDDGATWQVPSGVGNPWEIRRLITTSDGSHAVFLITGTNGSYRLLRSMDRGRSFNIVRTMGGYAGDLWIPRDGGSEIYLVEDDELYVSADLGDSWTTAGSLGTESERAELVGSEAGAPRLWAVVDTGTLMRSDDAGASWGFITGVHDYWGSLAASVYDPDRFAWGGVEVYLTTDGQAFDIVNGWGDYYGDPMHKLHADIPGIDVVLGPEGEEIWYVSTDGGLYRSGDGLDNVENLAMQGLRVSQYYSTLTSRANPDNLAAGAQDQGYQITHDASGADPFSFEQVISGDYAHMVSGDGTHQLVYSVYPGFILIHGGEDEPWLGGADFPADEEYAWLPPLVADPEDVEAFFFCATHLYRYELDGDGWFPTRWSEQFFGDGWYEYISAMAFSPLDPQLAWLTTSSGRVFHSEDRGVTWTQAYDDVPTGHYFYGQALLPSALDTGTVYIGGSGYSNAAIHRSTDGGVTWHEWDEGMPDTMVYSLAEAPDGSGRILAGTETAAYMRTGDGSEWIDITGVDAPVTIYWSAETLYAENTIRFGTYGRGIWDYQLDPNHTGCYPVQDYDSDGELCDSDCDDHDPAIHSAAEEICDNDVDEDCDGEAQACEEADDDVVGDDDDEGGCECSAATGTSRGLGVVVLIGCVAAVLLRRR
jgi:photosystem II stability/assembly factor-like uncharacterized protein